MEKNNLPTGREPSAHLSSGVLLALSTVFFSPAMAGEFCAWEEETYRAVARQVIPILPPALGAWMATHHETILESAAHPLPSEGSEGRHSFDSKTGKSGVLQELRNAVANGLALMEKHAPAREIASALGLMSHLASDLANPFHVAEETAQNRELEGDFAEFAEKFRGRFRATFDGYPPKFLSRNLEDCLKRSADASLARHPILMRAYYPQGERVSSSTFTERSAAFGVASLSYSQAVSATALVWTHFWRQAHGDMKGTPFLAVEHR